MEHNETFKTTYSAQQQEEIQAIRNKYTPKKEDKMTMLRKLDAQVTKKASSISVAVGTIGALILGAGMSLIMTDFGALLGSLALPVGIIAGVLGMGILALAYPIYNRTLKKERERIAPQILKLTDELMK